MFGTKAPSAPALSDSTDRKRSVLAEDVRIEGKIAVAGILEFGGEITGDLTADALILNSTARVTGNVRARQLTIEGQVNGTVTARNLSIKSGAHVSGDFIYDTLDVATSASIDGKVSRLVSDQFKP